MRHRHRSARQDTSAALSRPYLIILLNFISHGATQQRPLNGPLERSRPFLSRPRPASLISPVPSGPGGRVDQTFGTVCIHALVVTSDERRVTS